MSFRSSHLKRKCIRLRHWDYGSNAVYFVTICTSGREYFFGDLIPDKFQKDGFWIPRPAGLIATRCWKDIQVHYPFVRTDEFIVMPNHIHGILFIAHSNSPHEFIKTRINLSFEVVSMQGPDFNRNKFGRQKKNLPSVLGGFKSAVTKESRLFQADFKWQTRYHERLIRNEEELYKIRSYIRENRKNWFSKNKYNRYGDLYI
jgi:putative transposase